MLDPYSQVRDTAPTPTSPPTTTGQAAAQINRSGALERLRALLGPSFGTAPITTDYGVVSDYTGKVHTGIDLAAAEGAPIQEPIGGTVQFARDSTGGNQAIVTTPQGFREVYAHLAAFPPGLYPGSTVAPGGLIGYVGHTGVASGSHLHYEVTNPSGAIGTMGGTVDPLTFIGEFQPGAASSGAAFGPTGASGPYDSGSSSDPCSNVPGSIVAEIQNIIGPLAVSAALTGGDAASQLRAKYPLVPVACLRQIAYGAGKDVAQLSALETLGKNLGDAAKGIGSIADTFGKITSSPQGWARLGLTAAAVGLIIAGMVLYAGSAVHPKVSV